MPSSKIRGDRVNSDGVPKGGSQTPAMRRDAKDNREQAPATPHPARNLGGHLKPLVSGLIVTEHHRGKR